MNKVAEAIGWITMGLLAVWFLIYVSSSVFGFGEPQSPDKRFTYYWECRVSRDNIFAPWKQISSIKARTPDSCGGEP